MKKIALLLCAVLVMSAMLFGCGRGNDAEPVSSAASDAEGSSEATTMPTTPEEIVAHNVKIDESEITLVQFNTPAAETKTATIKTSMGDIKMVLFPDEAPKAVENFLALAEKGYYNGMSFYEVLPSIRIATGDPDANGSGGESSDGELFKDEYSLNLWHFNGAVAMDNGGVPDANGSRFYIVQNSSITNELAEEMLDGGFPEKVVDKYLKAGGVPNYDFKDTVFGQVIEGKDVVEKIAAVARDEQNKPSEDVTITSIEIGAI
ncbi:peptidylprolyl isomerase [Anaerotruncus rubiinfantis]|uniref:peptidylprolyl isomerase n=1 Tax=Anaerotruncus rubiinfantis TaxID=1720200 RepID=UPI0034A35FEB